MGNRPFDVAFIARANEPGGVLDDVWRMIAVSNLPQVAPPAVDLTSATPRVYITLGWDAELEHVIRAQQRHPAHPDSPTWIIWWCLDRTLLAADVNRREQLMFEADVLFDEVWVSDPATAALSGVGGYTRSVLLGGVDLLPGPKPEATWDVTLGPHVRSSPTSRRILRQANGRGLRCSENELMHTRVMLNDEHDGLAARRFALAASYGLAVVSRPIQIDSLAAGVDYVVSSDVVKLAQRVIAGDAGLPPIGLLVENLHEQLVEDHPFAVNIYAAVEGLRTGT